MTSPITAPRAAEQALCARSCVDCANWIHPKTDIQEATGLTADQLEMLAAKTGTDQPPLTIDRNASAQALLVLGGIYKEELGLELRLRDAVAAARRSGCSWEMIGAMLGTSRQAAQERFGKSDQQQAS